MTLKEFMKKKNTNQIGAALMLGVCQGTISKMLSSNRDVSVKQCGKEWGVYETKPLPDGVTITRRKVNGVFKYFETRQISR